MPSAVEVFRRHMARVGVRNVSALAGAAEAMRAAAALGLRVLVVTSKIQPLAEATLANAGLRCDEIVGDRWGAGKAAPLRAGAAIAFVGDNPADMLAAGAAQVVGIGVTSGSSSRDELSAAGASVVLSSLRKLPAQLPSVVSAAGAAVAGR
jgi:phosphoglycolate phosphatase